MKKTLLYLAALACCLFSLTACGDDDEPVMATGTYTITFGADFYKVVDFAIIYYKAANGDTKREIMNSGTTWTKTITTSVPAELAYKIELEPLDEGDFKEDKDSYDISMTGAIQGAISQGGTGNFSNSTTFISSDLVAKSKVANILNSNRERSYGYRLDKNGNATQYTPTF